MCIEYILWEILDRDNFYYDQLIAIRMSFLILMIL